MPPVTLWTWHFLNMERSRRAIRGLFRPAAALAVLVSQCAVLDPGLVAHAQSPAAEDVEAYALAARNQHRFATADSAYRVALESYRRLGDPVRAASVLEALGAMALEAGSFGDPGPARNDLTRALAIADSLRDPALRSRILRNLAWAQGLSGDAPGADARARESLAAASEAGDSTLVRNAASLIGRLALDRGRAADAEPWFERALASSGGLGLEDRAEDLIGLATAREFSGRLDPAEAGHRQALELALYAGSLDLAQRALIGLGGVAERRRNHTLAIEHYREAIALIDSSGRTESRPAPGALPAYESMVHLHARLEKAFPDSGFATRGFMWAERAHAQTLLVRRRLLGAPEAGRDSVVLLGLEDAQRLLISKRVAMLYYSVGDSSTSLWVLRRDEFRHLSLPSRRALRDRVRTLRTSLADPSRAGDRNALTVSHQLYRALIQPAEPWLKGVSELIVVPDGELASIPFEALLAVPATDLGPTPRDFLISRFAISYAPSATVLGRLSHDVVVGPILAIGDTNQLETLSKLARKRSFVGWTSAEASRSRLLAAREFMEADVLHLASPATANDIEPERSGVRLAAESGGSESSFVGLADLVGLRLRASQVTIPACEAGLGRIDGAEGVVGFAHGFLASGAESVLLSHWRVRGRSTDQLLERYYGQVLKAGLSRAGALADAKRILLQDVETRSPYFWAPFVLVGGSGPLD